MACYVIEYHINYTIWNKYPSLALVFNGLQPFNITLKIVLKVGIGEISIVGRSLKTYTLLLSKEVPVFVDIKYVDLYQLKLLLKQE